MKLIVVDYGAGNLGSVTKALTYLAIPFQISHDSEEIATANGIILPGVGAFPQAMQCLEALGIATAIQEAVKNGTPVLGICLGMQLLFDKSEEFGETAGLSLIPGTVRALPQLPQRKIPHIGWNQLHQTNLSATFHGFDGAYVYYVHSFFADCPETYVVATSDHGIDVPGIVQHKNVIGMQFHPEKSSVVGLSLLKSFKEMIDNVSITSN